MVEVKRIRNGEHQTLETLINKKVSEKRKETWTPRKA
jgi:hypothetical protein